MFRKMSLKQKLQISICGVVFIAFAVTIYFITSATTKNAEKEARNLAVEIGYRYGNLIKADLDAAGGAARSLANTLEGLRAGDQTPSRDMVNTIIKRFMEDNPDCYGVWSAWEPNAFDGKDDKFKDTPGSDPAGLYQPYWHQSGNDIKLETTGMQAENDPVGAWYWKPLRSGKELVNEPTVFNYDGKDITLVAICVPIKVKGKVVGVAGVDFSMEKFKSLVGSVKPYETGFGFFLSNEGYFVAHPMAERVGKKMGDLPDIKNGNEILGSIRKGELFTETKKSISSGEEAIYVYTPFTIGRTNTPWCFGVSVPVDKVLADVHKTRNISILIGLFSLALVFGIIFLISVKLISAPINAVVEGLKDIAQGEGDLTRRLVVSSEDEIGSLATWFNIFIEKIHIMIRDVSGGVETLSISSSSLAGVSTRMNEGIRNVRVKSSAVASASEEMSSSMNSVAAAMEESAANTNMLATASEEMSSTINEIARNAERARSVSGSASHRAMDASSRIDQLGVAAKSIGKVVETITDISDQVNLLALNATIEAARAGDAGKGFAVVANEIKELARQTAEATKDISEKVGDIQSTTSITVNEINEITTVIAEVNEVVNTIAAAVEEQSAATTEIAGNVAQVSSGIQEVNVNVNQSSAAAALITRDITGVNDSMAEMSDNSSKVDGSAHDLSGLAEQLRAMVGQFKI